MSTLINEGLCKQLVAEYFRRTRRRAEKPAVVIRELMQTTYAQGFQVGAATQPVAISAQGVPAITGTGESRVESLDPVAETLIRAGHTRTEAIVLAAEGRASLAASPAAASAGNALTDKAQLDSLMLAAATFEALGIAGADNLRAILAHHLTARLTDEAKDAAPCTTEAQAILADVFQNSDRPDKITISLDRVSHSVTVTYADMDEEWFAELDAAVASHIKARQARKEEVKDQVNDWPARTRKTWPSRVDLIKDKRARKAQP